MEKATDFLTQNETVNAKDETATHDDDQVIHEDGQGTDDDQSMMPRNDDAAEEMDADNFMQMYEE
ncbi:MAG: hypothetical protein JRD04_10190, partial [Deltaproteobacteria bacterium]|nr:hypothetical protein [Deltaproteobacteria bacterium]